VILILPYADQPDFNTKNKLKIYRGVNDCWCRHDSQSSWDTHAAVLHSTCAGRKPCLHYLLPPKWDEKIIARL